MDLGGQNGSPSSLILRALEDEQPAIALARQQRSPQTTRLMSQLFVVAVRRCFAAHDTREITGYVHDLLTWLQLPARGLLARQIEALMRAVLGEPALATGIGRVRRHEIICTVVGDLARPPALGHAELAALVTQAQQRIERSDPAPRRAHR